MRLHRDKKRYGMQQTPASLLERLRQPGDREAWERFVRLYTPLLCMWARRLGLRGQDVDDLVQEIFAILVPKLPEFRFDAGKRFRGWLWTVTANKVREQSRRRAFPAQADQEVLDKLPSPDGVEIVDESEYRDYLVKRAVKLMRSEFQPTTWQAFWECFSSDRSAAEVADELGMTVDAVYAAKSRVLRRLRQELAGLLD